MARNFLNQPLESGINRSDEGGNFPFLPLHPLQPRSDGDSGAAGRKGNSYQFSKTA